MVQLILKPRSLHGDDPRMPDIVPLVRPRLGVKSITLFCGLMSVIERSKNERKSSLPWGVGVTQT